MSDKVSQNELEVARQIIRKAYSVYIPERTRSIYEGGDRASQPRSKTPLPPFAFGQKRIIEIVQQSSYRDWLIFAYTDGDSDSQLANLAAKLGLKANQLPAGRQPAGRMLATLALMDVKRRLTADRKMWSIRQLCQTLSLNEGNWGRDYSGYWLTLRKDIERMDRAALTELLRQVDIKTAHKMGFC